MKEETEAKKKGRGRRKGRKRNVREVDRERDGR